MSSILATAAVAPVVREPSVRAELVTQLVLGEPALVRAEEGDWLQIETAIDRYPGWIHRGYVRGLSRDDADAWLAGAAWSDGASLLTGGMRLPLPLRARVQRTEDIIELPDGRSGTVGDGLVADLEFARAAARKLRPDQWVMRKFTGAPYLWGGVTPWGVDCSGLVQTAWLARGAVLPRDASAQATIGSEINPAMIQPGDLLFFADGTPADRVTHVTIAAPGETMIHSTLRRGGVVVERWNDVEWLMARLVTVRRISDS